MEPSRSITPVEAHANFDRVARVYRWAEYGLLGPFLTRTRRHFLPQIQHARHALVLGDGDGRFLADLLHHAPTMRVMAIDSSASMLRLLRARCTFAGSRVTTVQGCVNPLPHTAEISATDLIVTHFLLDCLNQRDVDRLAHQLSAAVQPGCLWVLSEFGIPRRQPWQALARVYIRGLYLAFRILTGLRARSLPDLQSALANAGFRRIHRAERLNGLLYSEVWQQLTPVGESEKTPPGATSLSSASSTLR